MREMLAVTAAIKGAGLGKDVLLLTSLAGREAVSEPFAFDLEVMSVSIIDAPPSAISARRRRACSPRSRSRIRSSTSRASRSRSSRAVSASASKAIRRLRWASRTADIERVRRDVGDVRQQTQFNL